MRRPRGPGGRFLTAEEVLAIDGGAEAGGEGNKENMGANGTTKASKSKKRKSEPAPEERNGKKRRGTSQESEDDEDEDEAEGDDEG